MNSVTFHDNHFNSIQALRGIAAIFVILEHIRFLNCGAFGVDIFFCISGFMIMFSTHKGTDRFLLKRAVRILPLYYLMTIGTFVLLFVFPSMFETTRANAGYLIKSLLFIPFDIGNGILQPLMRIGWTINCEIFFYLMFFLAYHISHRFRGLICSAFLSIVVLTNHLVPTGFAPLRFYGDSVMLEFILGILCYYIAWWIYDKCQKNSVKCLPFLSRVCVLIVAVIFTILVITKPTINILGFRRFLFWGLPAMLMVLCTFIAGLTLKMPKALIFLGNMSFSIYLIHYYPIMLLDRLVFDFSAASSFTIAGAVISVIICLFCALVSWIIMEQKLPKLLLKK
jgi:peptidoglycan/LPS O-acetylase OafA/YrhL